MIIFYNLKISELPMPKGMGYCEYYKNFGLKSNGNTYEVEAYINRLKTNYEYLHMVKSPDKPKEPIKLECPYVNFT